jgi:hypothetical protein
VFVALVTQHAKRIRCIIFPSLAYLAVEFFSKLSKKWQEILSKVVEHKFNVRTVHYQKY